MAAGGLLGCVAVGGMFSLPVLLQPITQDTGWSVAGVFDGEFSNVTRSYSGKGVVRYAW